MYHQFHVKNSTLRSQSGYITIQLYLIGFHNIGEVCLVLKGFNLYILFPCSSDIFAVMKTEVIDNREIMYFYQPTKRYGEENIFC